MTMPAWVEAWCAGVYEGRFGRPDTLAGAEWMRSRPASVQRLMERYPPFCVVEIPAGGTIHIGPVGIVYSFHEDDAHVTVIPNPDTSGDERVAICGDLRIVGYWRGLTRSAVKLIFGASPGELAAVLQTITGKVEHHG